MTTESNTDDRSIVDREDPWKRLGPGDVPAAMEDPDAARASDTETRRFKDALIDRPTKVVTGATTGDWYAVMYAERDNKKPTFLPYKNHVYSEMVKDTHHSQFNGERIDWKTASRCFRETYLRVGDSFSVSFPQSRWIVRGFNRNGSGSFLRVRLERMADDETETHDEMAWNIESMLDRGVLTPLTSKEFPAKHGPVSVEMEAEAWRALVSALPKPEDGPEQENYYDDRLAWQAYQRVRDASKPRGW